MSEWYELQRSRVALITQLVSRVSSANMGRTMLMKLCFFLQEVRGLPLGYRFTIYSYGPFDSQVLSDLDSAVNLGAVRSKVVYNPIGYGYQLSTGPQAEASKQLGEEFLRSYEEHIDWAVKEFASKSVGDLELESTIVFVHRDLTSKQTSLTFDSLADRVRNLKPHFDRDYVLERERDLATRGLLQGLS
jgi:uncharacterized protein